MRCSELMSGDIVRHKYTKEIIRVFEIDDERNVINNEPDGRCGESYIRIDNIEPVAVTPDILINNGFEEKEENEYNQYILEKCDDTECYSVVINWRDSYDNGAADGFNLICWDEQWSMYIDRNGDKYSKENCKVIYFHELQHGRHICGIEKSIVL